MKTSTLTAALLVPTTVLFSAASCGGGVLQVGSDADAGNGFDDGAAGDTHDDAALSLDSNGPDANGPDANGIGSGDAKEDGDALPPIALPDGALPVGIAGAVPFPTSPSLDVCESVVGTSASDLWCLGRGDGHWDGNVQLHLLHWDGAAWSAVPLPTPLAYGTFSLWRAAPAARGVVWIATELGVARMHADGTQEIFSAPGFDGSPISVSIAQVGSDTFLSRDAQLLVLSSGAFVPLAGAPADLPSIKGMQEASGSLWIWGTGGLVARASGASWASASLAGSLDADDHTVVAGSFWTLPGPSPSELVGISCQDGCQPTQNRPWHMWSVDGAGSIAQLEIDPPGDLPHDGSVRYDGIDILTSGSGKLALLGCVSPATGQGTPRYAVVHEWDGAKLGLGRRLPDALGCPFNGTTRSLSDGTWVFERGDRARSLVDTFVLVIP